MNSGARSKVALITTGLVIATLLSEIILRATYPQNLSGTWLTPSPLGLSVNRANWTTQHQFKNIRVQYTFNELHMRGDPINTQTPRVLFLGDSFTFGWLLPREQTFVGLLEQRWNNNYPQSALQFSNAASGGWGTIDQLGYLEEFGDKIAPKAIVLFIGIDDIERAISSNLYDVKKDKLIRNPPRAAPFLKRSLNALPFYQFLLENSHLLQFLRQAQVRIVSAQKMTRSKNKTRQAHDSEPQQTNMLKAKLAFERIANWAKINQAPLLILTVGFEPNKLTAQFLKEAPAFFSTRQIVFHDLRSSILPELQNNPVLYIIPGDSHPNKAGAGLIAREAWPILEPFLNDNVLKSY